MDADWTDLDPTEDVIFNNALWFTGFNSKSQLYQLGSDGSVTQWTANPGSGIGLDPTDKTVFNGALWFAGKTPIIGTQLFKLGSDGSVTQWTAIGTNLNPSDLTVFNNAAWFNGFDIITGQFQLYKLGNDGGVTKWTANPVAGGLNPQNMTEFNGALWFTGETATGTQLFKLGNDGSVTQWTAIGSDLAPIPVSTAAGDLDSTPLSVFNNALWFQANSPASGNELFKLGADGSFTFWKDINPGINNSFPHDWAPFGS
jgi:ELWxxDGT repeat protein